ncbi:hypothetical protein PHMEG_00022324 [Phytophthora megakarya]|uniref:Reverse transcriptase domain-containing protein n=1 Tax=Phytophthora megakarya TaxID=4795 RepID=A0A225VJQ0_9STRA|nr:hypothetical protein PHMEG_00022324 [Phytophthora megakarya]
MSEGIAGVIPCLQLPLAKASQEILSYMTDRGMYTPTRVRQGSTDATLHFQSTVEDVLKEHLHGNLFATEPLDVIEAILTKLDEFGFKLNPKKCKVFLTEMKWCGKIINEHGVGHDPKRIESLRAIPEPTTAAELRLVDYAKTSKHLQELLERSLRGTKRSKRVAAGTNITFSQEELDGV